MNPVSAEELTTGRMIPHRGLMVHQQRCQPRDSNTNVDINFSEYGMFLE